MIPWWAWILGGLVSIVAVGGVAAWDRRTIRRRISAEGGVASSIRGPFPALGFDNRMERRRYQVAFRDRAGRARTAMAIVAFGHTRLDLDR